MLILFLVVPSSRLRSQTQAALLFESATQQGVQEAMYKNNITKIANNVVYTAGASLNASGDYDIIITKHNNANVELWTQVWSNASFNGLDMAADLTIDANGDVIVVGTTQLSLTDYDAVILKYSSSGTLLWSQTFAGSANGPDGFVTVLASGTDIYCGGSVLNNVLQQHNALAVKYNASGTQVWSHQYNSNANLHDAHNRIALSGSNVVYYGGVQTLANPITWTMVRLELVGATGAQVSANLSNNASSSFTKINDIDLDTQDNLYIAGYLDTPQGRDIKVVKLMSMAVSWTFTFNGADNLDDEAHCIDVNGSSLYVAGYTTSATTGKDAYMVRIPTAGPPTTWQKIIDEAGGDDQFTALNIDVAGQLYLAGSTFRVSNLDLTVHKVNFQNGTTLAQNTYNNDYNGNDYANGVAIDEEGNVFVASQAEVTPNGYKCNLVKWAQKTLYMPVVSYSTSGGYISNVSQLRNSDGSANQTVLYYNQQNRVATYLDDSKLMYQLVQGADSTNADTSYRVDMRFTKGSTSQKVYALQARKEYHNYYLGHMWRNGERTPVYNSIWKNNVYTNTDILYTNSNGSCKQYIIARSGAPTGDFEMTFDGQTNLTLSANGNLIIQTTIGSIEYAKPKAYIMNLTTGALTLHTWQPSYVIVGNKVSFSGIGAWGGTLVLEVGEKDDYLGGGDVTDLGNISWSTYYGATGDFKGSESYDLYVTLDNQLMWVGMTGSLYFPVLLGLDPEFLVDLVEIGHSDGAIVNIDADREIVWATFYGGIGIDSFTSISKEVSTNNFYVGGHTSSNDLIYQSQNTNDFQSNYHESPDEDWNDKLDGLILKITSEGQLLWNTCLGSSNHFESIVDIVSINGGYFVVGNCEGSIVSTTTEEPLNLPIWDNGSGATYDSSVSEKDIFLMRFNNNNTLDWSTLYGNGIEDEAYEATIMNTAVGLPTVVIGIRGNIPAVNISNFPNPYLQTGISGGLIRYNTEGQLIWATAIKGTHSTQSLAFKSVGGVNSLICGSLFINYNFGNSATPEYTCDPNLLITPNGVCMCNTYSSDIFDDECLDDLLITEFNSSEELIWSTFLGGSADESASLLSNLDGEYVNGIDDTHKLFDITYDVRGYLFVAGLLTRSVNTDSFPFLINNNFYNGQFYENDVLGSGDTYLYCFDDQKNCIWATVITAGYIESDPTFVRVQSEWPSQIMTYSDQQLILTGTSYNQNWPYMCPGPDAWCVQGTEIQDAAITRNWVITTFDISDEIITNTENIATSKSHFLLFPNPATETISIISKENTTIDSYMIFNTVGEQVDASASMNGQQETIDVSQFVSGVYLLKLSSGNKSTTLKFVIE